MKLQLSQVRAEAVLFALQSRRAMAGNLKPVGYGRTCRIAAGVTEADRRNEFTLAIDDGDADIGEQNEQNRVCRRPGGCSLLRYCARLARALARSQVHQGQRSEMDQVDRVTKVLHEAGETYDQAIGRGSSREAELTGKPRQSGLIRSCAEVSGLPCPARFPAGLFNNS